MCWFPLDLSQNQSLSFQCFTIIYTRADSLLFFFFFFFFELILLAYMLWACLCACSLWTVAHQAPLSVGFSSQEYWSGLLCPPPGDRPYPGIEPISPWTPALQVDPLPTKPLGSPVMAHFTSIHSLMNVTNNNDDICYH